MTREKPLSIMEITQELNLGIATIKFILKRFSPWLPFERANGLQNYSPKLIPLLIKIKESLEAGMLPSEIDQELKTSKQANSDTMTDKYFMENPNENWVSKDGLSLIKSLFDDIAVHQNRVATAHEKRAEAEERKASAIEKRAEAEEKKAMAMNNIANALQEMNQHRINDSQTREVALQAAQVLAVDETKQDTSPELNDPGQQDTVFNSPPSFDLLEASEIDMDDLSDLIEDDMLLDDPLVDVQNISGIIKTDDLYALIDQDKIQPADPSPMAQKKKEEALQLDDLSKLLDPTPYQEPHQDDIDDLSELIDTVSAQGPPARKLDDLSLLIDDISSSDTPVDNLSLLIEPPVTKDEAQVPVEIDNLSLLIATTQEPMDDLTAQIDVTPSLKPIITPEENLKEYKAAVMKIILGLKTQGLNAKESTIRLNQDGVQTISGKSKWSEKAISQIYYFIDSAR